MDQLRERKRAEAHMSPAPGQVNAHALAGAVAATVAATAQVKVH